MHSPSHLSAMLLWQIRSVFLFHFRVVTPLNQCSSSVMWKMRIAKKQKPTARNVLTGFTVNVVKSLVQLPACSVVAVKHTRFLQDQVHGFQLIAAAVSHIATKRVVIIHHPHRGDSLIDANELRLGFGGNDLSFPPTPLLLNTLDIGGEHVRNRYPE